MDAYMQIYLLVRSVVLNKEIHIRLIFSTALATSNSSSRLSPAYKMPNPIKDLLVVDHDSFPYIYEENHTVKLQSNPGLVRLNVYRPKNVPRCPILVTYGPYGKDIPYRE
jgi:hypothetical protein